MSLYFIGNGRRMAKVRDKVLISQLNYRDISTDNTRHSVQSPDGVIMIEFHPHQAKVCIQDVSLFCKTDSGQERYNEKARPYIEQLRDLLKPRKILDLFSVDLTSSLGIQ